jgi:hypothetical protein
VTESCRPEVVEDLCEAINTFLENYIQDETPSEIVSAQATVLSRMFNALLTLSDPANRELNRIILEKTLMELFERLNADGNTGGVRH